MSEGISDKISIRIDERLSNLLDASEKPSIFKIHGQLRSENEEAYQPQVVSIGPYHHGKPKLEEMEKHKLRYFRELLCRRGESSAEKYILALALLQDQARRCYAEKINLSNDDFVEMLCLDGCFVIEFLRKIRRPELRLENDPIFQMPWLQTATGNDLILFENQLPIFVLLQLFDMTKLPGEENLIDLAIHFSLSFNLPDPGLNSHSEIFEPYNAVHLLGLMHKILSASFSETLSSTMNSNRRHSIPFIKSAGELRQSGIKFEKAEDTKSLFHITFENGVLKIPPLYVGDQTESFFRNLIAYEEYMSNRIIETWRCITDYIIFIYILIDSPSDVETLLRHHIIVNWLGSDEALSTMFKKISKHVKLGGRFCYTRIFDDVDKYSRRRWRIWRANLVRKYFNTLSSFISFLAACALLLLTIVQAIFSILQYTSGLTKQK